MVQEYTSDYYIPVYRISKKMMDENMNAGVEFTNWRVNLQNAWDAVAVRDVKIEDHAVKVNSEMQVKANVHLGDLKPSDVRVQLYYGPLNTHGEIAEMEGHSMDMTPVSGQDGSDGTYIFETTLKYQTSGDRGISVRVLPYHPLLTNQFRPKLITWA
jgi:starch phosphorylase